MGTTHQPPPVTVAGRIDDATFARLVEAATRAPSIHNTQPWRVVRGPHGTVELHYDPSRNLAVIDAGGRGALLSCGAALLNLRLAWTMAGVEPVVRVQPRPKEPTVLASVGLGLPRSPAQDERELHDAIPRRHTYRAAFAARTVEEGTAQALLAAVTVEGATGELLTPARTAAVLALEAEADRLWASDPAYLAELWQWTDRHHDGIPTTAFGPRDVEVHAHLRDFGRGRRPAARPTVAIADQPLLLLISTPLDSTRDSLLAGMAMQRVLLAATAAGLAATFLDQALEHPELRWLVRDPVHGKGMPQVLLRIGYPTAEPTVTPRRPTDVVTG